MASRFTSVMGFFLANSQPAESFRCRLSVRYATDRDGQTDKQTEKEADDGHQRLMPPPYRGKVKVKSTVLHKRA